MTIEGAELLNDEILDFGDDFESRELHPEGFYEFRVMGIKVGRSDKGNKCVYFDVLSGLGLTIKHTVLVGNPSQDENSAPQANRRFGKMLQVFGFDFRGQKSVRGSDFSLEKCIGKVFVAVVATNVWETNTGETRRNSQLKNVFQQGDPALEHVEVNTFGEPSKTSGVDQDTQSNHSHTEQTSQSPSSQQPATNDKIADDDMPF